MARASGGKRSRRPEQTRQVALYDVSKAKAAAQTAF